MIEAGRARRRGRVLALALLTALLATVATGCAPPQQKWLNPPDPLEPMNRAFFTFNMGLDRYVAEPISKAYRGALPGPVRSAVRNFFRNLAMPYVIVNDVLQGQFKQGATGLGRFMVNSTLGAGGLGDPAKDLGWQMRQQHFAATAGVWGMGPGPYLVLPVLGPTTMVGLPDVPMRIVLNPVAAAGTPAVQATATGAGAVSEAETRREKMRRVREAVEPYSFMQSGFMQQQWEIIRRARGDQARDASPLFEPLPELLLEESDSEPEPAESSKKNEPSPPPSRADPDPSKSTPRTDEPG